VGHSRHPMVLYMETKYRGSRARVRGGAYKTGCLATMSFIASPSLKRKVVCSAAGQAPVSKRAVITPLHSCTAIQHNSSADGSSGAPPVHAPDSITGHAGLLVAAAAGRLSRMQWLQGMGAADSAAMNERGSTALLLDARHGHLETVKWLLGDECGTSVGEMDSTGSTPLLVAARRGQLQTVQWLLSAEGGADIDESDDEGSTALLLAATTGKLEMVQWLLG
jgi:ankyrin repeat protein